MATASIAIQDLAFHPIADIFPLLEGEAFEALVDDIRQHGLREAIWLHSDGSVLDGRNRFRACQQANVEPSFRTWDGDDASLVSFVVSLNLHRRHLDASQRAMVAGKIATLERGANQHASIEAPSQTAAAELLNVSRPSVQRARQVIDSGAPELVQAVERGDVAVSAAVVLTELSQDEQVEVLAGGRAEVAATVKAIKAHVGQATGDNEWYTPTRYIDAAREAMGEIDCDPASSEIANRSIRATIYHSTEDNGLVQPWAARVWMNPPYAQPLISDFCAELIKRIDAGEVRQACVLVNNATETGWGQQLITRAAAVCFPRGRVRFIDPEGQPSGAPLQGQIVAYFGTAADKFAEAFASFGVVLWA
jgi:ParB family chromosome partitioning protein